MVSILGVEEEEEAQEVVVQLILLPAEVAVEAQVGSIKITMADLSILLLVMLVSEGGDVEEEVIEVGNQYQLNRIPKRMEVTSKGRRT